MKTCTKCGYQKPLTEYFKCKQTKDGHMQRCKECATATIKARIAEKEKEKSPGDMINKFIMGGFSVQR